jgi:hypothetical protein
MRLQRSFTDLVVVPAQVWEGLTVEAQARAIQLMARLASNLVLEGSDPTRKETQPCLHGPVTPRSGPSISTAAR